MSSSSKAAAKRLPEDESCVLREETTKVCDQQKKVKLNEDLNNTNGELIASQLKSEEPKPQLEDCTVCYLPMKVVMKFPCEHHFCFSCAKGMALHTRKCGLCRKQIPKQFLARPNKFLVNSTLPRIDPTKESTKTQPKYRWYYAARRSPGWWQYDNETSDLLEDAYKNEQGSVDIMVSGMKLNISFLEMLQCGRGDPREIQRDQEGQCERLGVAGLYDHYEAGTSDDDSDGDDDRDGDGMEMLSGNSLNSLLGLLRGHQFRNSIDYEVIGGELNGGVSIGDGDQFVGSLLSAENAERVGSFYDTLADLLNQLRDLGDNLEGNDTDDTE